MNQSYLALTLDTSEGTLEHLLLNREVKGENNCLILSPARYAERGRTDNASLLLLTRSSALHRTKQRERFNLPPFPPQIRPPRNL